MEGRLITHLKNLQKSRSRYCSSSILKKKKKKKKKKRKKKKRYTQNVRMTSFFRWRNPNREKNLSLHLHMNNGKCLKTAFQSKLTAKISPE